MSKQLTFEGVKGYATYANAEKRGKEIADKLDAFIAPVQVNGKFYYTWMVVAMPTGRFLPVFACNNIPGGPGPLIGEINVGMIN